MRQDFPTDIDMQQALARVPLFSELDSAQIIEIAARTHAKRLPKGATLFQRGDPCHGCYVVLFGQIKLGFRSFHGDDKVVEIIGAHQSFGEAVMFLNRPYPVYAEALSDTLVIHVASAPLFAMLDRDSSFARKMLAGLSKRLHTLIQDVEAYSLHSSAQRVIGYLLEHCAQANESQGEVFLATSKQVIASRLNLTPETLSRIFGDLSKAGLITVSGKQITIHDLQCLRGYWGGSSCLQKPLH